MKYTVVTTDTSELWYKEGTEILHREGAPTIISTNGDKFWYRNGLLHNLNGPAVTLSNGEEEYYIEGVLHTKEEFEKATNKSSDGRVVLEFDKEEAHMLKIILKHFKLPSYIKTDYSKLRDRLLRKL